MNVSSLRWKQPERELGMWMLHRDRGSSSVIARSCLEALKREILFRNSGNECIQTTRPASARLWNYQNWKRKDSEKSFACFARTGQCDGCVWQENSSIHKVSTRSACWESRPILPRESKLKKRCKKTSRNSASSLRWHGLDGGSGTRKRDM